jgi:hypothetical protein
VGDPEPQPTTPPPPTSPLVAERKTSPTPLQSTPRQPSTANSAQSQIETLLSQLYAGQLPGEASPEPLATALRSKPAQAPPTPSPSSPTNHHLAAAS